MDNKTSTPTSKNTIYDRLRSIRIHRQTLLLVVLFLGLAIFFTLMEDRFLTVRSVKSMGFQIAEIGLLTIAMMLTILVGGINLSIVAISNLSAVIAGLFIVNMIPANATPTQITLYLIAALLIALLVGVICGLINGILVGYIGVNAILATLATMSLFAGISTGITGGKTVTGFPEQLAFIGNETILGIPIPFIILIVLAIIAHIMLSKTPLGFKALMLGSNPTASSFSGVNNKSLILKVHVISALFASVAGILIMSRTMSAAYEYGSSYLLLTILITVLGGIIPGSGKIIDILIAILTIQILSTGFHMVLRGWQGSAFFKDFSYGILLIIVLIIRYSTKRNQASS